jgi:hypothetical protein
MTALVLTPNIVDVCPSEDFISMADRMLFEQIVEAECYPTWDIDGYFLIAQTVMNQLDTGKYGNTIREVLTRNGNYSVYANGRYKKMKVSPNAIRAVRYALDGAVPIELNDVDVTLHTLFCTKKHLRKHPNGIHGRSIPVLKYENVIFFQERG